MPRLPRLLLGAALAAGLTAPARAAEVDPLLPAETEAVVFVNVRQVIDSKIIKTYALGQIKQALEGEDAQRTIKALSLDPLKDIDTVSAGSWGQGKDMTAVFSVRGKFDPQKLFDAAKAEAKNNGDKVAIVKEGEYTLIQLTPEKADQKPVFVAVADEKTIVGGTTAKLAAGMMAAALKPGKPAVKPALAALIQKQDDKASLFMCGLVDGKAPNQLPPNIPLPKDVDAGKLGQQIQKIETAALTVRLGDDIGLDIAMGLKDGDAADDLGESLDKVLDNAKKQLAGLAFLQPNFAPLITDVTNSLKTKVKDKDLTVSVKVTADAIGKAANAGD